METSSLVAYLCHCGMHLLQVAIISEAYSDAHSSFMSDALNRGSASVQPSAAITPDVAGAFSGKRGLMIAPCSHGTPLPAAGAFPVSTPCSSHCHLLAAS